MSSPNIPKLLAQINNMYLENRSKDAARMYETVRCSLDPDIARKIPREPIPFHCNEKLFDELIKYGNTAEVIKEIYWSEEDHNKMIEVIKSSNFAKGKREGIKEEKERIRNLSWWERLWKLF